MAKNYFSLGYEMGEAALVLLIAGDGSSMTASSLLYLLELKRYHRGATRDAFLVHNKAKRQLDMCRNYGIFS